MNTPSSRKRRQLVVVTGTGLTVVGAIGLWRTLENKAYPQGAALTVDLSQLEIGKLLSLDWLGKPIWVLRRTSSEVVSMIQHDAMLTDPQSAQSQQPPACRNGHRSLRPDIFVAIGVCTHQGCTPGYQPGIGFLCPCHASRYDLAGRVFKAGPAMANLVIPAHRFASVDQLVIGEDA
jgi:ubiquinol-cytochrome c reductase iron-sulfur subunit